MRNARLLVPGAVAITLAACGSPRGDNAQVAANATAAAAEPAAAAPQAAGVRPGMWNFVGRVTDVSLPGLPPAAALQMKTGLESKMASQSVCITAAEANRPPEALFRNDRSGECAFANMTMAGGRLGGEMTCRRPTRADPSQTTSMTMAISGSYTPTTYTIDQTATFVVPGRPDGSAKMRVTGVRTGDCPGGAG